MKKAIFVATTTSFITGFEMRDINLLQNLGYEIHIATNSNINNRIEDETKLDEANIIHHQIDFARSPFKTTNLKAYKQLKKVFAENNFDLVHCHTPVGGVLARMVAKKYLKTGIKVIYTAHGFHFFKGNNVLVNFVFHTIEKKYSKYTDTLITINDEDYEAAKKFNLHKDGKVYKINGIGIDAIRMFNTDVDIIKKREELHVGNEDIILLSVGELNENKNHAVVISALEKINNSNLHYFIVGKGNNEKDLILLINKLGLNNNVHLLGYRRDVIELCKISNIYVFPSFREGLSVALMEAMACGLPIVASKIRGNTDLIDEGKGGYLISPTDINKCSEAIKKLLENKEICNEFGKYNKNKIKDFDICEVSSKMLDIYKAIDKEISNAN
jgi:glycosyltransferase involved in cell wall biosynthesis